MFIMSIGAYSYVNVSASTPSKHVKLSDPVSHNSEEELCMSSYEDFLEHDWRRKACVGGAFIVVKGDRVILVKTTGVKSTRTGEPVTENSVFRLGSVSKGFAGVLAGMLVEEGHIEWQDKVKDYMPDLCMSTPEATNSLCIENILSHSTGLIRHAYTNLIEDGKSIQEISAEFRTVPIVGRIGRSYAYQNAAYSLIEEVASEATGEEYADLLEDRIFTPLGMNNASSTYEDITSSDDIAMPHSYNRRQARITRKYYNSKSSGGINASINDMGQWLKLLLGNYPEIMDDETLDEVFAPRVNTRRDYRYYNRWPGFQDSHYAIGWRVLDLGDRTLMHHGGYVNGYRSEIAIDRENKIAICALFNSPCAYAKEFVPNFFEFVEGCSPDVLAAP